MSQPHRSAALAGATITLRAVFTDEAGALRDPDALPVLYIYDEESDTATIEAEAEAKVYTTAVAGPLTSTKLSTGYYTYDYAVPAGSDEGTWRDLWVAQLNTADDFEVFSFVVTSGFDASSQTLGNNMMVVVELDSSISDSAGEEFLTAVSLYYTTTYAPLYASPDLIRLEMGRWIDYIPDDTLALMAHLASKEANFIQGPQQSGSGNIKLARTKFVVFDAVWRCINIPGAGKEAGYSSGKKKALGDLSITDGAPVTDIPDGIYEYVREQRQEWWRVVNAGGNIVPGQGLSPGYAVKGLLDPDRRLSGRLWNSPEKYHYAQPSVNSKSRASGMRRGRFGFRDNRGRY